MPAELPPVEFWGGRPPAIAALTEIATLDAAGLQIDWEMLILQAAGLPSPAPAASPDGDILLDETDVHILTALAERPQQAMQLADLMAAAGYSKQVTRVSLQRLRQLGLAAKPPGTRRKGDAITTQGTAWLHAIKK